MPVPDFSPGEVLTAAAMDSIGLWLVKTQTVGAGVSAVTVTGAFNNDYQNYKIIWAGGTQSLNENLRMYMSGTAAAGHYGSFINASYTGGAVGNGGTNNGNFWTWAGGGGPDGASANLELLSPFEAKWTEMRGSARYDQSYGHIVGVHTVASSYTSFTFTPQNGTMSGGTIRVYGYRN
jgi:hypothetical protein